MSAPPTPDHNDIAAFARRYGLDRLSPEQVSRMAELAAYVADLGRTLPRPAFKSDRPASTAEIVQREKR